jgi:hypothetical protein
VRVIVPLPDWTPLLIPVPTSPKRTGAPFQTDFRAFRTYMCIFPPLRGLVCRRMMCERPLVEGQRVEFTPVEPTHRAETTDTMTQAAIRPFRVDIPEEPAADDVQTVVIPGAGHWVAEQAPEEMLAALTAFLAPYRDGDNRE